MFIHCYKYIYIYNNNNNNYRKENQISLNILLFRKTMNV